MARVYVWGRWLVVVTNGARNLQRDKLQTTGLEDHFDAIAVSGELGVAKPDPTIFRHTLLGAPPGAETATLLVLASLRLWETHTGACVT